MLPKGFYAEINELVTLATSGKAPEVVDYSTFIDAGKIVLSRDYFKKLFLRWLVGKALTEIDMVDYYQFRKIDILDRADIASGKRLFTIDITFNKGVVRYDVVEQKLKDIFCDVNQMDIFYKETEHYLSNQLNILGERIKETQKNIDEVIKIKYNEIIPILLTHRVRIIDMIKHSEKDSLKYYKLLRKLSIIEDTLRDVKLLREE